MGREANGHPYFGRPVAQKVLKLKKIKTNSFSTLVILALNLSSGVSSKNAILCK
jgi:hypothetical protein